MANDVSFKPVKILEVEIGQQLPSISSHDPETNQIYQRALALVRLYTQPLGLIELKLGQNGLSASDLARQVWSSLNHEIDTCLSQNELPKITGLDENGVSHAAMSASHHWYQNQLSTTPFVSIAVPTRDRPEMLRRCLSSLLALDYPHYEIIVVDNAPKTTATADLVQRAFTHDARVRYVHEDRPGVAWARNRGLHEAKGEIIAYTDDDIVVDSLWLTSLVRGFNTIGKVACVTGLTLPARLETPSQAWFEQFGGFGRGFTRQIFDLGENKPKDRWLAFIYPYAAGIFGGSHNMALLTSFLHQIGGFDPALGAGSPSLGGEDLAAFFQVITKGYRIVYEPAALCYHSHRRDYSDLRKQIYAYGAGLTAYLTKCVVVNPLCLIDLSTRVLHGIGYALNPHSPKNSRKLSGYPKELDHLELWGMLHGPFRYLLGRYRVNSLIRQFEPGNTPCWR